jgi:hypothetical protein
LQIEREELHAERVGSFAAARLRSLVFFRSQVPRHRADRGLDSLLFSVAQIVNGSLLPTGVGGRSWSFLFRGRLRRVITVALLDARFGGRGCPG